MAEGEKMKIHYLSDIHVDHYISETIRINKQNRQIDEFFRLSGISKIPPEDRYMFIIPGDLSNYNSVAKVVLLRLKELFKYILIVPGNHDLYMCSTNQANKYKNNSFYRLKELKDFCSENDIIFLDGQIVEIDGKRFGGAGMFWDKSYYNYLEKREASDAEVLNFYDNYMNDSKFIMNGEKPYKIPLAYGGSYFKSSFDAIDYFKEQYTKLQNYNDFDNIDVMVSHYVPTIPYAMKMDYAMDRGTTFYMFDGEKDIERISPKVWLFGHMHGKFDFVHKNVRFLCNPLGYPQETLYVVDWFEI
jgi:Icc-related predicted phosphoesterase